MNALPYTVKRGTIVLDLFKDFCHTCNSLQKELGVSLSIYEEPFIYEAVFSYEKLYP